MVVGKKFMTRSLCLFVLPSVVTVLAMGTGLYLLSLALRHVPVGTAYAVWTGTGMVVATLAGMALFGEPRSAARLGCIALILSGVIGLRVVAGDVGE